MPGLQIRRHRDQVLDVSILGANRAAPHASVRDGGAGVPTRGHRRGRARPQPPLLAVASLRCRRWARRSISWSGALMLRPARAGRGGLRVGRRARCRQKLGLGLSPLEDRWSNCLFFMIAAGYQPPLANVATQPPRYAASVATAPERRSWVSASPVTSVRRQPPRTVRERPRLCARVSSARATRRRPCRPLVRVAPRTPFGCGGTDIDTTPGTPGRRSRTLGTGERRPR